MRTRLLASLGKMSWVSRAAREMLVKQRQGEDTKYTHHWMVMDLRYAPTPTIAKDAKTLANMRGQKPHRSAEEPAAPPIFPSTEIRLNALESGADDFGYPPTWRDDGATGRGSCNTNMVPYDQLVAAILQAIKHHLGVIFRSRSAEIDIDYCPYVFRLELAGD